VAYFPRILIRKNQTLALSKNIELDWFTAARHNWSLGGAWGDQGEATHSLGRAGAPPKDALTVVELEEEGHPVTRTAPITAAVQEPP
jgi:hypothetical protein